MILIAITVVSERGQSSNIIGVDPDEILTEVQAWKTDIVDNHPTTPRNMPMMILVNRRDNEAEAPTRSRQNVNHSDLGYQLQGELTQE